MFTRSFKTLVLAAAFSVALAAAGYADGNHEWSGVNNKTAPASPAAGSAQPGGISNVDDYTQMEDQIQIPGTADAIVKVLRVNQKNLVNDYVVRIFPLLNANPTEVRQVFREIAAIEGGRSEVIIDPVKKLAFVWFVAPKFQMPYIEAAVKALDEPWLKDEFDGSATAYYRAKFRAIGNIATMLKVTAIAAIGTIGMADDNLITVDEVNNAALMTGEPYRVGAFLKRAPEVDIPVPQVLLEAAVYEVEVSKETRLGLDYIAWKNGPGRNLFDFIFWGSAFTQASTNKTSIFDPFVPARTTFTGTTDGHADGWYMGANYLLSSAYLDFLEGTGRARLVTRGKILVKNGQPGTLSAVDQTLYFATNPDDTNTPPNGTVPSTVSFVTGTTTTSTTLPIYNRELDKDQRLDIGFSMTVTPYIAKQTTQLGIVLAASDIVGQTPSGTPQVRSVSLTTTVLVQDNKPFCVGGIRRTEDVKNTQKMPILGSIPILGYFFGHEATVKRETEIIVVLTPKIRQGTEADLEMANDQDKEIRKQVERRVRLDLPCTEVGFDQWLIGGGRLVPAAPAKPAALVPPVPAKTTEPAPAK